MMRGMRDEARDEMRGLRDEMRAGFEAVKKRLDSVERKIGILNKDVLDVRAGLAGIDSRVTDLEASRK